MIRFSRDLQITRYVDGGRIFAEVSYVERNGVYIVLTHRGTGVNGHMSREHATALRDALTRAIESDYWPSPSPISFDDLLDDTTVTNND